MKKFIKFTLKTLLVLVILGLILLLASPLWLGPFSAYLANKLVPGYTETQFKVAKIHINPYTGSLYVEDFHLGNTKDYDAEDAVSFSKLSVDINVGSLFGDTLHVKNIDIVDPYVYVNSVIGYDNLKAIQANLEKNLDLKEKKEEDDKDKKQKKIVIDRFSIDGMKFQPGIPVAIPVPFPTLTNLGSKGDDGKKEEGITMKEMGDELASKFTGAFSSAGSGLMNLGSGATDAVKNVGAGAVNAVGKTADVAGKATDVATDAVKSVGEGAKSLFKGATGLFGGDDKDKK